MTKIQLPEKFLLVNKPLGWTSFDVVGFIRKKMIAGGSLKNIRVGHSGTLDPFATGLLIVGVGREATKRLDEFKNLQKTYVATVRLGAVSDTGDSTGVITPTPNCHFESPARLGVAYRRSQVAGGEKSPSQSDDNGDSSSARASLGMTTKDDIEKILQSFLGPQLQIPPMYSAKKIAGKKLYELARQGKTVERQPTPIEIYDIKLLDYAYPKLTIEVTCSAGTYIRTLTEDIGKKLGTGAYCSELIRTTIGPYRLEDAVDINSLNIVI